MRRKNIGGDYKAVAFQLVFFAAEFTEFLQSHWQPAFSRLPSTPTKMHEPLDFRACRDDCTNAKQARHSLPEVYTGAIVFVVY